MDTANLIQTLATYALPVLFAITVHEVAHGYVARHFGDATAAMMGRLTLNPLKHIDPIGTVVMPLALYFLTSGGIVFGYAKPVPVNFAALHNPRRDSMLVAAAGPGSNFAMALGWALVLTLLSVMGVEERFFLQMCQAGVLVNVVMFALNLFPLPPLDGGRVLAGLLPPRAAAALARIEPYGCVLVMGLIALGALSVFWIQPVMRVTFAALQALLWPLQALLS